MSDLVYDFSPEGKVEGMHHDCFSLGFLGTQKIQRASDIRFNEETQQWDIWLFSSDEWQAPTASLQGFAGYDAARRFEVLALNTCRKLGLRPTSPAGDSAIRAIRDALALPESH